MVWLALLFYDFFYAHAQQDAMMTKTSDEKKMKKQSALKRAIGQLEKQAGQGAIMVMGEGKNVSQIDTFSTGSLGLDKALITNGLPKGQND